VARGRRPWEAAEERSQEEVKAGGGGCGPAEEGAMEVAQRRPAGEGAEERGWKRRGEGRRRKRGRAAAGAPWRRSYGGGGAQSRAASGSAQRDGCDTMIEGIIAIFLQP